MLNRFLFLSKVREIISAITPKRKSNSEGYVQKKKPENSGKMSQLVVLKKVRSCKHKESYAKPVSCSKHGSGYSHSLA